ncbi:MAG: STAS domain-containing protein [Oscillatoriales cyanobacterium RM2_1_1]|nr:STAS domain-containing protein [Oscillatoriales cyanobacterium SM2_3_0]NJO47862.1 STAS domain-containing protein [Oscillatoriales cyanobacterium RM2_1_1]
MNIQFKHQDEIAVIELAGDIDANTAPQVQQQITPLFKPESQLLLDLTRVSYMSSAGLRILLTLHRYATANHCRFVLVGLSEEVKDVMSVTGFLKFFITCNTVEAGLKQLNSDEHKPPE